jgi:hypothetical protein
MGSNSEGKEVHFLGTALNGTWVVARASSQGSWQSTLGLGHFYGVGVPSVPEVPENIHSPNLDLLPWTYLHRPKSFKSTIIIKIIIK